MQLIFCALFSENYPTYWITAFLLSCKIFSTITAQKMRFSIKDFFIKCEEILRKPRICSHLLKKSLMENFIFCAVNVHETKGFLQLNLNTLFCKKVLGLSLGLFALLIILLPSSPVFQDSLSSLYMTRPFLQKRQTSG